MLNAIGMGMEHSKLTVNQIIDAIKSLTPVEYSEFASKLETLGNPSESINAYVEEQRFSNGRVCPMCGSAKVVRNGKRKDGVQKYCCKECYKSFVAKSSTITSGTRKPLSVWMNYIECMMNWTPVRESAERCGISEHMSFIWRHKILDAMQIIRDQITLEKRLTRHICQYPIKGIIIKTRIFTCRVLHVNEAQKSINEVYLNALLTEMETL